MNATRRNFFHLGLGLAATACGGEVDDGDPLRRQAGDVMGFPPWLMWGTSQTLHLTAAAATQPPNPQTFQLARVNYGRPETWHFFFSGRIVNSSVAAGGGGINLSFDLTIGLGRTAIQVPHFVTMGFPIVGGAGDLIQIWSTLAKLPPQFAGDTAERLTDKFVAQDVQCQANVTFFAASLTTIDIEIGAFFAPNVHVRPEWFADHTDLMKGTPRFRAGENQGM